MSCCDQCKWHCVLLKHSPASTQASKAGRHPRQAGTRGGQAEANKYEQKKRHPDTNTPKRRTPGHPTPELLVSNFNLLNNSLKLDYSQRRKRHGLRKTNSALKKSRNFLNF